MCAPRNVNRGVVRSAGSGSGSVMLRAVIERGEEKAAVLAGAYMTSTPAQ